MPSIRSPGLVRSITIRVSPKPALPLSSTVAPGSHRTQLRDAGYCLPARPVLSWSWRRALPDSCPADGVCRRVDRKLKENINMADKKADLAGPGIGDYAELEHVLPGEYSSLLSPKETQKAIFEAKQYIEENLCHELNLMMVTVPLIVDVDSGVNDYLDRDGSRTPIQFHISNDRDVHPIDAQVVQAATKWKRVALQRLGMQQGEGICTDMRAGHV